MLFGEQRLFLGRRVPRCLGTRCALTGPTAVDSFRAQKVVAVLASLPGKPNQYKSSFFFFSYSFEHRCENSAVFCFIFVY